MWKRLIVIGAIALAGLCACTPRDIGVVLDPLPPTKPLRDDPPVKVVSGPLNKISNLNPFKYGRQRAPLAGERQVDVVQMLATGVGVKSPGQSEAGLSYILTIFEQQKTDIDKQHLRNEIVSQLTDASLANCDVYLKSLRGSQVASRTFFDLMTGSLSTAGGLATPVRSARLLSGMAAFSNGAGASVDRDVFAEVGVELVAQQIGQVMTDKRTAIEQAKINKTYAQWDLGAAIGDVTDLFSECSMVRGLGRLQNAVATRDADLKTARQVVARVTAAGGTPAQVNAALAGVVGASLIEPSQSGGSARPDTIALDIDLQDYLSKAQLCLDWAWTILQSDKKKKISDLTTTSGFQGECYARPATDFSTQFFSQIATSFNGTRSSLTSADQTIAAAFADIRNEVASHNSLLAQQIADRRQRAWMAAASMLATENVQAKATAEIIAASATTIAGGALANPDPALLGMAQAASAFPNGSTNGAAVAGAAQGALRAYLEHFVPIHLDMPSPPPPPPPPGADKGNG